MAHQHTELTVGYSSRPALLLLNGLLAQHITIQKKKNYKTTKQSEIIFLVTMLLFCWV